jgi:hypothetical protein
MLGDGIVRRHSGEFKMREQAKPLASGQGKTSIEGLCRSTFFLAGFEIKVKKIT